MTRHSLIGLAMFACGAPATPDREPAPTEIPTVQAPLSVLGVLAPVAGQTVRPGAPFAVRVRYTDAAGGKVRMIAGDQEASRALTAANGTAEARLIAPTTPGALTVTVIIEVPGAEPMSASVTVTVHQTVPPSRCAPPTWWEGDEATGPLPARLTVRTQHFAGQDTRPVSLDVDFAALTAQAGLGADFDPATIRVVEHRCDGEARAIPGQWSDAYISLFDKRSHTNPTGDGFGSVTWRHDVDDSGADVTAGGAVLHTYGVYFGGADLGATTPAYPSWGTVDDNGAENSKVRIQFAPDGGRLLYDVRPITHVGSLGSVRDSCCGNGPQTARVAAMRVAWSPAQIAADATHALRESGPVYALWETSGVVDERDRDLHPFAYEYRHTTMLFADSPDVWMSIYQAGLTEIRNDHLVDPALGLRPFEMKLWMNNAAQMRRRSYGNTAGVVETDGRGEPGALAFGYHQGPRHVLPIGNPARIYDGYPEQPQYIYLAGNDVLDLGGPSIATLPAGDPWFDEVGVMIRPLDSFESFASRDYLPMLNPITVNPEGVTLRPAK